MAQGKVLVVDDAADIAAAVQTYLAREGYQVTIASDGREALDCLDRVDPDVIVLDLNLPLIDGFELCREIRKSRNVPLLILSARDDDMDKVLGLELGADDYMTKPFNPKELVARVRAMFRRLRMSAVSAAEETIVRRGLKIHVAAQRVELDGVDVTLTPIEFGLLRALAGNPSHVHSRQDLLNRVWGPDFFGDERTVDSHIRNLRAKLQKITPATQFIRSVWGVGYRFEP
ncbi:MAG: response regulator transcription factor [Armatimonadetes bacterium]|nr:response regulator transcription factor [Armatimonadota bacterium]